MAYYHRITAGTGVGVYPFVISWKTGKPRDLCQKVADYYTGGAPGVAIWDPQVMKGWHEGSSGNIFDVLSQQGDRDRVARWAKSSPLYILWAHLRGDSAMPYEAEISRANPTCFLFLVDQSGSMAKPFGDASGRTKAEGVADAINRLVQTLVFRCAKGGYVLDRYYVGAIGYGSLLSLGLPVPQLEGEILRPVSMISNYPLRIEERMSTTKDAATGLNVQHTAKVPIWFEPKAQGKTLMCAALEVARDLIAAFVKEHPNCFPPTVINITDGMPTDGDPQLMAAMLRNLASQDGNALLMNVNISSSGVRPILFPSSEDGLPDDQARVLFRMSSLLPPTMLRQAQALQTAVSPGAAAFAFQADLATVVAFLDIGTKVDNRTA